MERFLGAVIEHPRIELLKGISKPCEGSLQNESTLRTAGSVWPWKWRAPDVRKTARSPYRVTDGGPGPDQAYDPLIP